MELSRRDFFSSLASPFRRSASALAPVPASPAAPPVMVVQGRFCLAYRGICSVCAERCPVPGAITVERGIPTINAAACNGCGICAQVCPAPRNAILQVPRRS